MDLLIALISSYDKLHEVSKAIFGKIKTNDLKNVHIPTSVFLEYELLLKSRKIEESEIIKDIIHFKILENIKEISLDSSIIILAQELRAKYRLTYFDSLHCASALQEEGIIISTDAEFKKIPNLKVIDPKTLLKENNSESN